MSGFAGSWLERLTDQLTPRESVLEKSSDDERLVTLADLYIRTKKKTLVPFKPNPVQIQYLDKLTPEWRQDHIPLNGLKEDILKARQFGFSTLIGGLFFCDTINNPNTTTVVVAHDKETTEKLFRMVQIFYDNLPPHKRPKTKYASKREFYWPELNSSYFVGTAGSKEFGRSQTINNLHCSEVAFYPDAETLMTGLLNAVPDEGNVFLESTANGVGNWYHKEYLLAEKDENGYDARFYAWWQHDEYRRDPATVPPPSTAQEAADEERLRKLYNLDDAQLAWRRWKMRQPGMRKKFVQEYPANPLEAFIASGQKFFDGERLQEIQGQAEKGKAFEIPEEFPRLRRALRDGELEIFEPPRAGASYAIGADPAGGLNKDGDNDHCSADVIDAATWTQVAHLWGDWDPEEFGRILAELGRWYNTALIAPERNNHGHAVIVSLHSCEYPDQESDELHGLYQHQEYDAHTKTHLRKAGFPTTTKTRPIAIQALDTAIDDGDIWIRSGRTVSELSTFVKLPGGKVAAQPGCFDDQVMSLAIVTAVLRLLPPPKPPIPLILR